MKFCRRSSFCSSVNDARSPTLVAVPLPPAVTEGTTVAGPLPPAVAEVATAVGPPDGTETLLLSTEAANGIVADCNELLRAGLSPDLLSDTNCGGENIDDDDEGANDADDADDDDEGTDDADDADDDDEGTDDDDDDDEGADDADDDDDEDDPPLKALEDNDNNPEKSSSSDGAEPPDELRVPIGPRPRDLDVFLRPLPGFTPRILSTVDHYIPFAVCRTTISSVPIVVVAQSPSLCQTMKPR